MNLTNNRSGSASSGLQVAALLGILALLLFLLLPRNAPQITLQNVDHLHEVLRLSSGSAGYPPLQTRLSPDGDTLLTTTGYDNDLWQLDQGSQRAMSLENAGGYTPLVFFSNGRPLAAFQDWVSSLSFLDMETGAPIQRFPVSATDKLDADWNLSPDNQWLILRDGESGLVAANLWTGEQRFRISPPEPYRVRRPNPTFSADGTLLATSLIDADDPDHPVSGLFVWDAVSGALVRSLGDFPADGFVDALAFSPDKKLLAVAGNVTANDQIGGYLQLWSLETGRSVSSQAVDGLYAQELAFTHDDRALAARSESSVWLWDVDSLTEAGAPLLDLEGVSGGVEYTAMALNPAGTLLAVGTSEGTISIYAVESGRLAQTLAGHPDRVDTLAFSDDGRRLISGGSDATVRFWAIGAYGAPALAQPEAALPAPVMTPTPSAAPIS